MSFDDDADVPMNDLMKQGCVSHQTVISLIGGARRMAPGGALADKFTARGYPVDNHPPWFGTRQQLDASLDEVDATLVEPVELGALVDETVDDTAYTPKNAVPKEQGSQVTHSAAHRNGNAARCIEVTATATGISEHHIGGAAESVAAERRHLRGGERYLGEDGADGRWPVR